MAQVKAEPEDDSPITWNRLKTETRLVGGLYTDFAIRYLLVFS